MEQKAFYGWLSFLFFFGFFTRNTLCIFFVNAVDQRSATKPTYCFFQSLVKLLSDGLRHEVFQPFDLVFSLQVQTPSIFLGGRGGSSLFSLLIYSFFFWSFTCSCITASVLASASVTHHLLSRQALQRRPFRVTNADRSVKKGIMADSLEDLMNKVRGDRQRLQTNSGDVVILILRTNCNLSGSHDQANRLTLDPE